MIAIVDAGPLFAALDANDLYHERSIEVLQRPDLDLVIPALVVAEVCDFASTRLDAEAEAGFLSGLVTMTVEAQGVRTGP